MRKWSAVVLGILLVVVAAVEGARWWTGRAPYSAEELAARADLRLVDEATAEAALSPNIIPELADGQQVFLGRVSWLRPARAGGALYVMVVHNRSHRPPAILIPKATSSDEIGLGSNGALWDAAERYPWLDGAAGLHDVGTDAVAIYSLDPGEATFAAVLLPADVDLGSGIPRATAPARAEDLTVALVQVNEHGRATWAQRLLN
ncbi:hypothetical protein [Paractinoplanes atraurantiacus]|uniref:Uncharacterized protein n=1 Tax=Paractinoplanes atraurantiacus TaxID=1036182 RepID=A0A285K6J3_9ACTN|nr:hypothetical protein [Actinoplanes atraurantiacus]SNY68168.1 hypothetical protein SAMN05421748_132104 [Actinoplanes atraurantiacus]